MDWAGIQVGDVVSFNSESSTSANAQGLGQVPLGLIVAAVDIGPGYMPCFEVLWDVGVVRVVGSWRLEIVVPELCRGK